MEIKKEIIHVNIDDIIPNRFQPRLTFDENALNELAESIKLHGIIQPLVLRQIGNKYEVIAGERRYKAATIAGLKNVPAIITELDDKSSAEIAVVENIQRKELSAIEEAKSYKKLLDIGQLTQEQLATRMGKSQPNIANKLRLLNLDEEIQRALINNEISERHARSLLQLKDPNEQKDVLEKIIKERLTVKQTDDLIKFLVNPGASTTINSLNESMDINPNIKSALNGLDIKNTESDIFNDVEPIIEDKLGETQILDINKIKEAAEDVIKPHELPDFNSLLKTEGGSMEPINKEQSVIETSTISTNKFFNSLEDEETNMNISDFNNSDVKNSQTPIMPSFEKSQDVITKPVIEPINNIVNIPDEISNDEIIMPDLEMEEPKPIEPISNPYRLRNAINMARDFISNLEKNGYNVDFDELDLQTDYQIVIKIKKD